MAKIVSRLFYFAGCAIVLILLCALIFVQGTAESCFTIREQCAVLLAFGSPAMIIASQKFYKYNLSQSKKNFILAFIPGFLCVISVAFLAVIFFGALLILLKNFFLSM